jgi:hypothetical protein
MKQYLDLLEHVMKKGLRNQTGQAQGQSVCLVTR